MSLEDTINDQAAKPQRVAVNGHVVEHHSLRDLVMADEHLQQNSQAQGRTLGLRFLRIRNRGTTESGDC